ncbi:choice-of-anchor D domain-containing protein [Nocardioides sp. WS12]|uniref:choice-of-anchor D domain-containing protein n=1 Tax=Nocardioides sp. WS12 TaxID=2486272 RepID=UPI0015FC87F7|nr:choice-of-anchor D domain-containing protein [Nocardioides sp. WS12]
MPRIARPMMRVLAVLVALLASALVNTAAQAAEPVTASPVSFGSIQVGKTLTRSVTLTVAAGQTIDHVQSQEGAPFDVPTVPATCSVPGPTECTVTATFSPTQAGVATGTLWVVTCSSSSSCSHTYVPMTGTGVAPGTSPAVAFGQAMVGATVTKPFTVTFDAGWFVRLVDFANQPGPATATFTVPAVPPGVYTDPCGASPTATSCTMTAAFRPRSIGEQGDTMRVRVCKVADLSFCTALTSTISGTGTAPGTVSPTSLAFGQVRVTTTAVKSVRVTLAAGWHVSGVGFGHVPSVPNPTNDFRYGRTTCQSPTVCLVEIKFQPMQAGSHAADAYVGVCNAAGLCVHLPEFRITGSGYQVASRTTLKASAGTPRIGSPMTLTATVTPGAFTYDYGYNGTMTFYDGKSVACAAVPVNDHGVATCSAVAAGPTGVHTFKAVYSGNPGLKPSTSTSIYKWVNP